MGSGCRWRSASANCTVRIWPRLFIATAERFEHSAIFLHPNPGGEEEIFRLIDLIREKSGDRYFLMMHGDATYGLPDGANMEEFAYQTCR